MDATWNFCILDNPWATATGRKVGSEDH